ncbi:hypothetical protein DPMN_072864 [Dreissena polymorpha]|uniref:Uncharacterized protein n=1 Tax=Dreissena polymorpha TaxID=45954 RepID=A0A9D4HC63_DREPO|nr:hypothetical protein DPMN_072864 [Dreissena polymorpha]
MDDRQKAITKAHHEYVVLSNLIVAWRTSLIFFRPNIQVDTMHYTMSNLRGYVLKRKNMDQHANQRRLAWSYPVRYCDTKIFRNFTENRVASDKTAIAHTGLDLG